MRTVTYDEIRHHVTLESVIGPVRDAFVSYSQGKANIPPVQHLEMPSCGNSALHIKSGHVMPQSFCLVKVASTFPNNPKLSPPKASINGVIVVFSTADGEPIALLEDRAWITQIRTAGAGAVAAQILAPPSVRTLGIIGTGVQARLQAAAALHVLPELSSLRVWGRTPSNVERYVRELRPTYPHVDIRAAASVEDVARAADILVTATYSQQPLVRLDWVPAQALIIAMGADSAHKLEIDPTTLAGADFVAVDSQPQNEHLAEVGFGIRNGLFDARRIDAEIGDLLQEALPPAHRAAARHERGRVVCKLTGVAVQEIFVCEQLLHDIGLLAEERLKR